MGHCNSRYQVSFLMHPYYHENGARYIKKHEAIIRAIRNANIRFTGEVHQSEVFPTLVPPFSPRFTYLRHSIFPNVCEWKVRAKILHFVAKQVPPAFFSLLFEKYGRINQTIGNKNGKININLTWEMNYLPLYRKMTLLRENNYCIRSWIKADVNFKSTFLIVA